MGNYTNLVPCRIPKLESGEERYVQVYGKLIDRIFESGALILSQWLLLWRACTIGPMLADQHKQIGIGQEQNHSIVQ
jgi:hypothetical protein